jgi:hypothetical protein
MAGLSMLPDPIEGSCDWAKAGGATMVARTTTAIRLFIEHLLYGQRPSDRATVIAALAHRQPIARCSGHGRLIRGLLRRPALDVQVLPHARRDDAGVNAMLALELGRCAGLPRHESAGACFFAVDPLPLRLVGMGPTYGGRPVESTSRATNQRFYTTRSK